jgi:uncharacterized Rossmann fold enzyme
LFLSLGVILNTGGIQMTDTDYPRIVRGYYYMERIPPHLFVIEISGNGTRGDGTVITESDNITPRFFPLIDAQAYLRGEFHLDTKEIDRQTDIFNHLDELSLTDRIYVVAPGKNGAKHYNKLDKDCFTIIVNKACQLDIPRRDLWMVADPTVYNLKSRGLVDWFAEGYKTCSDIACFDSGTLLEYFKEVKYTHEWAEEIHTEFIPPTENKMRGGITISGRAVQMAYWLGAKEIVLCGVDLSGMHYFDDTDRGTVAQHHTAWKRVLPLFQELCKWIQGEGVKIYTISDTALDIPKFKKPRKSKKVTKRSK